MGRDRYTPAARLTGRGVQGTRGLHLEAAPRTRKGPSYGRTSRWAYFATADLTAKTFGMRPRSKTAGQMPQALRAARCGDNTLCLMRQQILFYSRSVRTLGPLGAQLHQVAWSRASGMYPGVRPADPDDYEARATERLAGCLALLRVYTDMATTLKKQIDLTIKEARALDATYGDIAAACHISRQAARQRWERHREQYEHPKVRLTGGPGDGQWRRPAPGTEVTIDLWDAGSARPSGYARYVPSDEDAAIYVFAGQQDYNWNA